MLAISTYACDPDASLADAVESLRPYDIRHIVLHRAPKAAERSALARVAKKCRIVAVFADEPPTLDDVTWVTDGGVAGEDREASVESLCRRLHTARGGRRLRIALRAATEAGRHPAPNELEWIVQSLRDVGYWHEPARATDEFLHAGARYLCGASFHPLETKDLVGLRDALPAAAPAVIQCAPGCSKEELDEAVRCARGVFRA
ncbi:MAG: hypothetical protein V3T86_12760 [Planctomycetota bacterium]